MIWWAEQPGRAQSERNAIGDLAEHSPWLANVEMRLAGTQLAFDFDLEIGARRIPLTLVYPDFFPDATPSILARERELLSGHPLFGPRTHRQKPVRKSGRSINDRSTSTGSASALDMKPPFRRPLWRRLPLPAPG